MAKNTCVNSVGQTKLKPTTLLAEQITPGGSAEHALHTWQTEVRFSSLIFCACDLSFRQRCLLYGFPASTPVIYIASAPQTVPGYPDIYIIC